MSLLARLTPVLVALALGAPAALARGGRDGVASGDAQREHERCARRVARVAPEGEARARRLRERVLAAWEAARADALRVIFDRALYPDEDHGRAGQPLVDEKVAVVRAVAAQLEPLVRKDLVAPLGLEPAQAGRLLEDALGLEARAAEAAAPGAPAPEPMPTAGLLLLAARAGVAFEVGARPAPSAWDLLLARRVRDAAILQANADLLRRPPAAGLAPSRDELEVVRVLGEYRQLMGLPALRLDGRLVQSARGHAADMDRLGFFAHESPVPGRESSEARMQAAGYPSPAGENIARGQTSPREAHEGWSRSSGHHRNLLSPDFSAVGAGRAGPHWVQNFGS